MLFAVCETSGPIEAVSGRCVGQQGEGKLRAERKARVPNTPTDECPPSIALARREMGPIGQAACNSALAWGGMGEKETPDVDDVECLKRKLPRTSRRLAGTSEAAEWTELDGLDRGRSRYICKSQSLVSCYAALARMGLG